MKQREGRQGATLLEMIVVTSIAAIVSALLLSGVMAVREAASRLDSANNLRQLAAGVHMFAQTHRERLPSVPMGKKQGSNWWGIQKRPSVMISLLPFIEQQAAVAPNRGFRPISLLLSPADPTVAEAIRKKKEVSSYAANAQVFAESWSAPYMRSAFVDGTGHTIMFAEHYAYNCGGWSFSYRLNDLASRVHRATFADIEDFPTINLGDPTLTFQVAPSPRKCNPGIPQTPHRSGMLVALGDGSVRQVAPHITRTTFWAAVTPRGGEVLAPDW